MIVPFTQYLRPNGTKKDVSISVDEHTGKKVEQLINDGGYFECEVLNTGIVAFYCYDKEQVNGEDRLLSMELTPNGPAVPGTVKKLIDDAYATKYGVVEKESR